MNHLLLHWCLSWASITGTKHYDHKQQAEGKVTGPHHSPALKKIGAGTQGGSLEAGTYAKSMERHCLLACPGGLLGPLSRTAQDRLPRGGSTTVGWALL